METDTFERLQAIANVNPLITPQSSILSLGRDLEKTSTKYKKTNDVNVVEELNRAGFQILAYKERKAHQGKNQNFKPYRAVYQNPSFGKLPDGSTFTITQRGASDGTSKLVLGGGLYRILCSNTLIVGSSLFKPFAIKHVGDVETPLQNIIEQLIDSVPRVFGRVKDMSAHSLSVQDALEFAERAAALRFDPTEVKVDPRDLLAARRDEDNSIDLWTTMNRVQENLIRGKTFKAQFAGPAKDGSDKQPRAVSAVKDINLDWDINVGLWNLASSYLH